MRTTVTADQLRALHPPTETRPTNANSGSFDLADFLARLGIGYTADTHEGSERFKLDYCPFDPQHGRNESAVFRRANGALGFRCQHNSCADRTWQDVRELIDGPREARQKHSETSTHGTDKTAKRAFGSFGTTEGRHNSENFEWPEPLPIPNGLLPVKDFDYLLLPEPLQPWAQDICERVQCAPDFVGAAVMAALAGVIGRKVGIRPQAQTDWTVTPNLWVLLIGRPGVLKSPSMEGAIAPLKRRQASAVELYEKESANHERDVKVAKLRAEAAEKAARAKLKSNANADVSAELDLPEPESPTLRRYLANDTTAAALGELMRQNPNGLLVFRDELVSLLRALDREDNAEARGFYLTGWNGDSGYTFDRIGRGMNLHIPAVCLSLLGSTQPGRIADYLRTAIRGGAGDDGLIQRFGMLVWPDTDGVWRDVDRWPDSDARREAHEVFEYLDEFDATAIGAQQDEFDAIPYLRFDDAALALFRGWRADLEAKLRSDELHPALESHLAKYRKLVPGLALICHLASRCTGPVTKTATLQALAWAEYLESHANRAYASVTASEVVAAKAIMNKLCRNELRRTFTARDIYRHEWARLSDREQVAKGLQLLVDLDQVAGHSEETTGRPKVVYTVNPRALA